MSYDPPGIRFKQMPAVFLMYVCDNCRDIHKSGQNERAQLLLEFINMLENVMERNLIVVTFGTAFSCHSKNSSNNCPKFIIKHRNAVLHL